VGSCSLFKYVLYLPFEVTSQAEHENKYDDFVYLVYVFIVTGAAARRIPRHRLRFAARQSWAFLTNM